MKKDIATLDDIRLLVDDFYAAVRQDDLLGPVFEERIADRWPEHLEKMYRFWQSVLLNEKTYFGSPFQPHADLPVSQEHFDRWLLLFRATLDRYFSGELTEDTKRRAETLARAFGSKIQWIREHAVDGDQ